MEHLDFIVTLICATLASGGVWGILQYKIKRHDADEDLLLGIACLIIIDMCDRYIAKGHMTSYELDTLYNHLYLPYKAKGGNGLAEIRINQVMKLFDENQKKEDR